MAECRFIHVLDERGYGGAGHARCDVHGDERILRTGHCLSGWVELVQERIKVVEDQIEDLIRKNNLR